MPDNENITIVLLPGLNGTVGLFDPLLPVATKEYELMVISYPTHKVKSYEELTKYVSEKILNIKPDMPVITFNTNHFLLQSSPQAVWEAIDKFVKNQSLVTK